MFLLRPNSLMFKLLKQQSKKELSKFLNFELARNFGTVSKNTKIGIVGCGNVGKAVANNLTRNGFKISAIYDVDKSCMETMPSKGILCQSAREVAELSDVIITGLPKPCNVKAAAAGPNGILKGLSTGKVWIDHSTTDFEQTLEFAKQAEEMGAHVIEAPITGGLDALKKGQMIVFIGGNEDVGDAMKPILNASYNEVFYVGEIGSAMIVKVVSNMLCSVHVIAMAEALMLAKRANLDLKTFWNAIRLSVGNSFAWETAGPMVFESNFDPGFTLELLNKDLQLGYDLARKYKSPIDMHQLALSIYRRTEYQLGENAGCYNPPKLYELVTGESLKTSGFENWNYDNVVEDGSLIVKHNNIK